VDSLVVGVYRGMDLNYVARVRAGFVPATRRQLFENIKCLATSKCPVGNLPEKEAGRWGQGFTVEEMRSACRSGLTRSQRSNSSNGRGAGPSSAHGIGMTVAGHIVEDAIDVKARDGSRVYGAEIPLS
jgi:hypothetical protein